MLVSSANNGKEHFGFCSSYSNKAYSLRLQHMDLSWRYELPLVSFLYQAARLP